MSFRQTIVLAAALWVGLVPAAAQEAPDAWTTARVNLRQGPGEQYEIITVLPTGFHLLVEERAGQWALVSAADGSVRGGWVARSLLVYTPPDETADDTGAAPTLPETYAITTTELRMRRGPSTDDEIITTLPRGAALRIIERAPGGFWVRAQKPDGSLSGWVSTCCILTQSQTGAEPAPSAPEAAPASAPAPAPAELTGASGFGMTLFAEQTHLSGNECTKMAWNVWGGAVDAVYLQDQQVDIAGTRSVCPQRTTTYTLRAARPGGAIETRTLGIYVNSAIQAWTDKPHLDIGDCLTISWDANGQAREVYYLGESVSGSDSRRACPLVSQVYPVRFIRHDGAEEVHHVPVWVGNFPRPDYENDLEVVLHWGSTADLDLHVTDPTGFTITPDAMYAPSGGYFNHPQNEDCATAGPAPLEVVTWKRGTAPSGQYRVRVNYIKNCPGQKLNNHFWVAVKSNDMLIAFWVYDVDPGRPFTFTFTR